MGGRGTHGMNSTEKNTAEFSEQEAVLKATAVRSPLPVMSSILPWPPCPVGGGGSGRGRGRGLGGDGGGCW